METIDDRVLEYQRAGRGIDELVENVCELVYNYPIGRNGFQKEDAAEFLLTFYPRIRRLIEKYRPTGSSFESYLGATLRWQLRSFAMQRASERVRLQTTCARETAPEIVGHDAVANPVG
ncbi:MAG: hypothetical protein ACOC1U_10965, partial [Spirochaetota bacterium]